MHFLQDYFFNCFHIIFLLSLKTCILSSTFGKGGSMFTFKEVFVAISKHHVKLMSNDHVAKNCNPSQDGQFAITQTTSAVPARLPVQPRTASPTYLSSLGLLAD